MAAAHIWQRSQQRDVVTRRQFVLKTLKTALERAVDQLSGGASLVDPDIQAFGRRVVVVLQTVLVAANLTVQLVHQLVDRRIEILV